MLLGYLYVNAVLYVAFSLWCILAPAQTASFLGLAWTNPAGESEYLTVYGGLQAGLAAFYLIAAWNPAHRRAALLFSLALYAGIVALRTVAAVRLGFSELGNATYPYGLEIVMLVVAVVLVARRSS